ncbi:MAG: asparaginase [Candidatus Eiseniibacteriota bacterium]
MRVQIEVVVWRGEIAESRHRVHAVAADSQGRNSLEAADLITTYRSAAKPFQLLPLVERGHADRISATDEEIAMMCASHTGAPRHVECVRGILARLGLPESALVCGYHDPSDPESLAWLRAHPEQRSPVYNNCSGKHAGMLALALAEGWPTAGYQLPEHPVQKAVRAAVAEVGGLAPSALQTAVDGCSVPVFALPLSSMARSYARLAMAGAAGDARERALARIRGAMMSHPRAIGGAGQFATLIMEALPGRVVAKVGAEGLECLGVPERGMGLAVRVEDGATRAAGPAVVELLDHLGLLSDAERVLLEALRAPRLRNAAGLDVGRIEASVRVRSSATS